MEQTRELLQKWDAQAHRLRMEVTGEGLMLGAATLLARMAKDERGRPRLALDDEPRALALLATAYEQPLEPYFLAKLRRACELWNAGERALAHIHLAHANLPPCDEKRALRLFVADKLIEAGVTPAFLMTAQDFDPAPLALLKYNPDQPRVPAGSGRESGEWTSGGANITTPVAFRSRREKGRHGRGSGFEWIDRFLELFREPRKGPAPEEKPPEPEVVNPESKPVEPLEAEQPPTVDANKLHHIFDNPDHPFGDFVSQYGSQEAAFQAIEDATRNAVQEQNITGPYKISIELGGRRFIVKGYVLPDGTNRIGTAYPWKN